MTRIVSNNQWSGGMAAHTTPKIPGAKTLCKRSRFEFLGSRRHPPHWLFSKWLFCWYNWRTFWRKNTAGSSRSWSCFCTINPQITGHLQPRRNWPTCASNVFSTHPTFILRIWLRRTNYSLDWTNNWSHLFSSTADVIAAAGPGWTDKFLMFFEWLAEDRATS